MVSRAVALTKVKQAGLRRIREESSYFVELNIGSVSESCGPGVEGAAGGVDSATAGVGATH